MLQVHGFSRVNAGARGDTRDLRVLWALEEMGLPYEVVGMDHPNHHLDTPEFRAKNRSARSPWSSTTVSWSPKSGAIVLYLARKSGKLMPRDLAKPSDALKN